MAQTTQTLLDYKSLADYTGVTEPVLRKYLSIARANREQGVQSRSDIPEPDIIIGGSPAWEQDTVDMWLANRPGKGVGGGPRPKPKD